MTGGSCAAAPSVPAPGGDFLRYFEYPFVRYALITGILISLCAGLLGVVLVLKRCAMIGDGLSHVAFGAAAAAAAAGLAPMYVALPVTVAVAMLLLLAGEKRRIRGEASIAMLAAGSMAVGYLLLSLFPSAGSGSVSGDVCSALFGSTSLMTLSTADVWLCVGLSAAVIVFFAASHHRIFSVTFDEGFARASGVRVKLYNLLFAAIGGVVIVLAMRLAGALLISGLLIFPALSAMRLFRSFRSVMICSAALSVVGSVAGLLLALAFSTPTGPSVVAAHIVLFALFSLLGRLRRA